MADEAAATASINRFWTAIVTGDRSAAIAAGESLDVPLVSSHQGYEFPDTPPGVVAGPTGAAVASAAVSSEYVVVSPRMFRPDTPQSTLSAWNGNTKVELIVIKKSEICGARMVKEGKEDFLACAVAKEACEKFQHRGQKADYYIDLPLNDGEAFAIKVRSSSQSAKPRVFSQPTLPYTAFPVAFRDAERVRMLTSMKLCARAWKVLLEAHGGYDWMMDLANERTGPVERKAPPPLNIPSPRVGEGGYQGGEFEDFPEEAAEEEEAGGLVADRPLLPIPFQVHTSAAAETGGPASETSSIDGSQARSRAPYFSSGVQEGRSSDSWSGRGRNTDTAFGGYDPEYFGAGSVFTPRSEGYQPRVTLADLKQSNKRIKALEFELSRRDEMLQTAFSGMRSEMDRLWKATQTAQASAVAAARSSGTVPAASSPSVDRQAIIDSLLADRPFRQQLVRLVLEDLDKANFITLGQLEKRISELRLPTSYPSAPTGELSAVSTRVASLETEMFKPEGLMTVLRQRVKFLEERRVNKAVERGHMIFKDKRGVDAFVTTAGDKNLYRFCLDFISLLTLSTDPFFTVSEGMASEAAAVKANYNSLLEARITLSYQITYPENIMRRSDKKEAALTDGWSWSNTWSTFRNFEGTFNNGGKDRLKIDLRDTKDSLQNAIEFSFPIETHATAHAIFTEQLSLSYDQAVAWLESLTPLFKTMKTGGLADDEAWSRVLVYTKALMEDIKTVRSLSLEKDCGAMIWGSFRTTELLNEYMRLRWIQHPQVSSILALTSLQREGKALHEAISALKEKESTLTSLGTRVTRLTTDYNNLKTNNPTLR